MIDEVQDCIDRNFDAVRKQMGIVYAEEVETLLNHAVTHLFDSPFQRELHQSFARWSEAQWTKL